MFSKLLVFGEMPVILVFSKLLGLVTCEGLGLSQSATQMRRSPRGVCSLKGGCRTCEEDSAQDNDGMHVLGAVK